jgi:lysosomal Pro-X carboxypeptidase
MAGSLLVLFLLVGSAAAAASETETASSALLLRTRAARGRPRPPAPAVHVPAHAASYQQAAPVMAQCQELYHEQPIDHFAYHRERSLEGRTFQQRYFVCAKDWWQGPGAPIFFYCGNEADVTLYLNATGAWGKMLVRVHVCDDYWSIDRRLIELFVFASLHSPTHSFPGLMWENAEEYGALIVFAEHRYYGESQPFKPFTARKMDYLR